MYIQTRGIVQFALVCVVPSLTCACSPLIDPPRCQPGAGNSQICRQPDVVKDANAVSGRGLMECTTNALKYTATVRDDMQNKARDEIQTTRIGGSALMLLAGVIGYKAGSGQANGHNILALTAGGTAAYGIGTIVTSQDRMNTYIAGASAVQCAINLAKPFVAGTYENPDIVAKGSVDPSTPDLTYQAARDQLQSCIGEKVCTFDGGCDTDIAKLSTQLNDAHDRFVKFDVAHAGMVNALCGATDDLRMQVNRMIISKASDISSLSAKLSVFSSPASSPSGGSTPKEEVPPKPANHSNLRGELFSLSRKKMQCATVNSVNDYIQRAQYLPDASPKGLQALSDTCSLASIDKTTPLEVDKGVFPDDTISINLASNDAIYGAIQGGSGGYSAKVTSSTQSGEIETGVLLQGTTSQLMVKLVKGKAKANDQAQVTVTDSAGHSVAVTVKVANQTN